MKVSIYDTTFTELTAALLALGYPLLKTDPIRRIFTAGSKRVANPRMDPALFTATDPSTGKAKNPQTGELYSGLQRGGEAQYRLNTESDQFAAPAGEVAQAYVDSEESFEKQSNAFDDKIHALREKVKGTEAGILFDELLSEFPCEIARYIRAAMDKRRQLIGIIDSNTKIVELVKAKNADGHFVLHHINCPQEIVDELRG